ncbi:MAG: hypothetical protein J6I38_04095 [Prevotella sp.]|nr:hypothetical protein [Prevotella sp.]
MMAMACMGLSAFAQQDTTTWKRFTLDSGAQESAKTYIPVTQYWKEHNIFQHLDISLTAGTTGIGIDVASPVGKYVQLRAGYEFMPRFTKRMKFDLTINGQPAIVYDEQGYKQETTFTQMNDFLYEFTGYDVEDHVDMIGKPTINNFKFLVDLYPFQQNKHWHFTAGFYWGPSRFAYAENAIEFMRTLNAVGIYNQMYYKAVNGEPLIKYEGVSLEVPEELNKKIQKMGRLGFAVGYFKHDIVDNAGNVIHKAGERYIVEPDDRGMVTVTAKSNSFKPYLGFGYGGRLAKNRDDWHVSFDCGAMFWGGTPDLYMHDGINLIEDVERVSGQVGTYVDLFKAFKVFPVLSFRITKRIF